MEHVRGYALERVDARCSEHERSIAIKAIDDALYGLMMMIDGVAPGLGNRDRDIAIKFIVQLLAEPDSADELVEDELNLFDGESLCGTYHMWMEGDYGADPIIDVGHSGDI